MPRKLRLIAASSILSVGLAFAAYAQDQQSATPQPSPPANNHGMMMGNNGMPMMGMMQQMNRMMDNCNKMMESRIQQQSPAQPKG